MNSIFRQKSIDKISSPEKLNDYVKVTNPSIWVILIGIVLILVGMFVWGICGEVDTYIDAKVAVSKGSAFVYVSEDDSQRINAGMDIAIDGADYVLDVSAKSLLKASEADAYILHVSGLDNNEWVCSIPVECKLTDGIYDGRIMVERIVPIYFIFN